MNWGSMASVKKGDMGEAIVRRILSAKGLIIYECRQDRGHVVDFYCQYKGRRLFAVEVKTYPRRAFYDQTGIDEADYQVYLGLLDQGVDVVIFWVDEFERGIYQNRISILKRFAQVSGGKVYFGLGAMRWVRRLTDQEVGAIRAQSVTDYALYENTGRFFNKHK